MNFSDLGIQLTRSCRALKLWISLRYFGLPAFREAVDRCLDLALHAERRIEASPELELMSPASLGVVTFRRHPIGVDDEASLERINADLADEIERGGELFISTGRVRGRYVLRLCVLNHSTSQTEVDRALELAESLEVDVASAAVDARPRELPRRRRRVGSGAQPSTWTVFAPFHSSHLSTTSLCEWSPARPPGSTSRSRASPSSSSGRRPGISMSC